MKVAEFRVFVISWKLLCIQKEDRSEKQLKNMKNLMLYDSRVVVFSLLITIKLSSAYVMTTHDVELFSTLKSFNLQLSKV